MARGHRMKGRSGAWLRFALPYNRRRRDGRVAEGARLESVYTGNRIVGSNPTLSASIYPKIRYIAERRCPQVST